MIYEEKQMIRIRIDISYYESRRYFIESFTKVDGEENDPKFGA